jgi:hypothetical protein
LLMQLDHRKYVFQIKTFLWILSGYKIEMNMAGK